MSSKILNNFLKISNNIFDTVLWRNYIMTKNEKHLLARKIIKLTNEEIDDEHFIHQLLAEST